MTNTALGAGAEKAQEIIFISEAHEKFYYEKLEEVRYQDVYHMMGTKNDIKWFGKILQRNSKIEVTEFSDLYPNKGTKKFYRAYVEVKKTNVAES